jgi:intraflagellar transport protein 172
MKDADQSSNHIQEFDRLALITHLSALKDTCRHLGLIQQTAKIATSLIRYSGDIPADKAFYEAGIACREANSIGLAFMFLNRYLDLSEAMEEGEAAILENADFENTDVPFDIELPSRQYLSEERRDDARSWVLQASLDHNTETQSGLTTRPCDNCGVETYEASLVCHQCKEDYEVCSVTGYPILRLSKINCTSCCKPSNREDWNKYLMKTKACPWCRNPQTPSY